MRFLKKSTLLFTFPGEIQLLFQVVFILYLWKWCANKANVYLLKNIYKFKVIWNFFPDRIGLCFF